MSTSQKPFSIVFGMDYIYTSESALMPTRLLEPTELTDYREELGLSLSMVRELVASNIWKAYACKVQEVSLVRNFMTRKLYLAHIRLASESF